MILTFNTYGTNELFQKYINFFVSLVLLLHFMLNLPLTFSSLFQPVASELQNFKNATCILEISGNSLKLSYSEYLNIHSWKGMGDLRSIIQTGRTNSKQRNIGCIVLVH